jgi:hypothetical protein
MVVVCFDRLHGRLIYLPILNATNWKYRLRVELSKPVNESIRFCGWKVHKMRSSTPVVISSLSLRFHPSRCRLVSMTRLLSSKTSNNNEAISTISGSGGSSSGGSNDIEGVATTSSAYHLSAAEQLRRPSLATSRFGLDPTSNRFHAPIVYHEHYSFADWPPNHTFPMDKFERIAHALQDGIF